MCKAINNILLTKVFTEKETEQQSNVCLLFKGLWDYPLDFRGGWEHFNYVRLLRDFRTGTSVQSGRFVKAYSHHMQSGAPFAVYTSKFIYNNFIADEYKMSQLLLPNSQKASFGMLLALLKEVMFLEVKHL